MSHRPERLRQLFIETGSDIIRRIKDPFVNKPVTDPNEKTEIITVTDVKVAHGLDSAKFFVSILATSQRKEEIMAGLKRAAGFVRHELGCELSIKHIPQVIFILDETEEKAAKLLATIKKANDGLPPLTPEEIERWRDPALS